MRLIQTLLSLAAAASFVAATTGTALAGPTTTAVTDTRVVNTVSQPIPVRDASWQVWRWKVSGALPLGNGAMDAYIGAFYTVPAGKRLLIEQGSIGCGLAGTTPMAVSLGVAPLANYNDEYGYSIAVLSDMGGGQMRGGGSIQVAANAGDVVFMRVMRTNSSFYVSCTGTLAGRLIDVL